MELHKYKYVFLLGIGGIGMSALARWFKANGFWVAGYDKTPTILTDQLEAEGMEIHFEDNIELIPKNVRDSNSEVIVILTPAIPKDHREWKWFVDNDFTIMKRSAVLGLLAKEHKTVVAVAGTHGKTTTSSIIAHLLKSAGWPVTAFLGGITQNYETNLLLSELPASESVFVVEADEYDRSFLTLFPDFAIITSADADHLDIYGSRENLVDSFGRFAAQVKHNGYLILKENLGLELPEHTQTLTYGSPNADIYPNVELLKIENNRFNFQVFQNFTNANKQLFKLSLAMPGFHNMENATAASILAQKLGLATEDIEKGIATFRGVKRRFEYLIERPDLILIDDYAHHPSEISALIKSIKALFPGKEITCIFQPHLFTRTRDFMEGFAESLSEADRVLLMDIYPAREKPIEGINSKALLELITSTHKILINSTDIPSYLKQLKPELILTVGAGDIDRLSAILKVLL